MKMMCDLELKFKFVDVLKKHEFRAMQQYFRKNYFQGYAIKMN